MKVNFDLMFPLSPAICPHNIILGISWSAAIYSNYLKIFLLYIYFEFLNIAISFFWFIFYLLCLQENLLFLKINLFVSFGA